MSHSFTIDSFEYEGRFFSMDIEYDVEWSNDGIGYYEYWGSKEYDAGHDYAEVTDYAIDNLVEHLANGETADIEQSDPIWHNVQIAVSGLVDDHSNDLEPPDDDGEFDCDKDRYDYYD